MSKIRIFLVEDHSFTRDGLRASINFQSDLTAVGEARSGEEALELLPTHLADVVVLDIGLPGMDGIEAARQIKALYPSVRIVMLTAHQLREEVFAALASGADAYCLKSGDPELLMLAIRAAAAGSAYLDPQIAKSVLERVSRPLEQSVHLTERELAVLRQIAEGRNNKEIALTLGVSVSTVKSHVQDLLEKLSASDRTVAAVKALRQGLL